MKFNISELNKDFSSSISEEFACLGLLDKYKSRGAFATYWNTLESDLKSVAASGWNAELIPEEEILQSQFPEILQEMKDNESLRDEIEAMFNEVNDLDELIEYISDQKSILEPIEKNIKELEEKLSIHNDCEQKLRDARKIIKEIKDRKEELVDKAREKITPPEAEELILTRWKQQLHLTIESYLSEYKREFQHKIENLLGQVHCYFK